MVGRRWILTQTARGAVGIAVLGFAGCSDASEPGDEAADPTGSGISPPAESETSEAGGPGSGTWS